MGRDPFEDSDGSEKSNSVEKLIKGKVPGAPEAREVSVTVRLTPSNLKHIDNVRRELEARGKTLSRNELIRLAISLLTADDAG
jgi:hypothetical protein